jgi:2-polyprenyl-3-methyl-5-hydroxy-6-metoxy-1,4-benzoquinol methylase
MSNQHLQKNLKPRDKAVLCLLENDIDTAEEWLEKALEEDENDHAALGMLADVCMLRSEFQEALGLLVLAIAHKPDEKAYLIAFSLCAAKLSFSFTQFNPGMAKAVEACLAQPEIASAPLWRLWYALMKCHPDLCALISPNVAYDSKEKAALAASPFFLAGLRRLVIFDIDFENALTVLRASLCRDLSASSPLWHRDDFLCISAALSFYCFQTEYIFAATPEEDIWIAEVRQKLLQSPADMDAKALALFACYESLGSFEASAKLAVICDAEPVLTPVADLQIRDVARMSEIKNTISSITPINDIVSGKVQAQYETFPYPRWQHLPIDVALSEVEKDVPEKARILVAGCGTGYEAAYIGMVFPKADILAVDLSKSSLSHAIARAKDLGLSHIRFAQADILQLKDHEERYDYILCSGVLHHMADPFAGWKVLRGLLNTGGLMRIALYSEKARRDIVIARDIISANGFTATAPQMKSFRARAGELVPAEALKTLRKRQDYYHMSMLCDLLFHVQEHRFNLVQIAEMLKDLQLEFSGFNLFPEALKSFHALHGPAADHRDITLWHALEDNDPDIFTAMYQFWCRAAN